MWARVVRRSAVLGCALLALAAAPAGATRILSAASGCTTSSASPPPGSGRGLAPNQLAAAYGFSNLWAAGDQGAGTRVALLEVGQALDPTAWSRFAACYAPGDEPTQVVASGSAPGKLGGEGILDPEAVAAAAPDAQIYMFESGPVGGKSQEIPAVLATLMKAALNPANTGGKLVNAISTSEITCEAKWTRPEIKAMQTQLRRAASLGVAVFAAAGDAGSVGSYLDDGTRTCIGWPVDESTPRSDWPGLSAAVDYPGSSPEVTSVGGTELVINGVTPAPGSSDYRGDPAGGTITDEMVWNEETPGRAR